MFSSNVPFCISYSRMLYLCVRIQVVKLAAWRAQTKIKSLVGAPTQSIDLTASESPKSSYQHELMTVGHDQLVKDLAKYKLPCSTRSL